MSTRSQWVSKVKRKIYNNKRRTPYRAAKTTEKSQKVSMVAGVKEPR